ncbi:MAG: DMT family transporter [Solirubrobacterales bacterium]|nr:DMT family transporter [Solirubrobacterales bacterium]
MLAVALGLASSMLWGLSDYLGGVKSRTFPVALVLAIMYVSSLTVMAIFVSARGAGPPGREAVLAGLCAGLFGIAALTCFYRALAIGTMSIVAPVASTGVALPVLVGLVTGDKPGALRSIGLAAAVVGVVLASREDDEADSLQPRAQRLSIVLAIVAGLGFGMYFVLAEISSDGDIGWALLLSRMAAAPFVLAFAVLALRSGGRRPQGRELAALALIGLLDLGANFLFNYASTVGELSTVAVASSLYPVVTVLLAAALLGERVRGVQRVGVVIALVGVVAISAGA